MKTKKLTEVMERIEAWPPEVQDELADFALELDTGLSDGEYQPTPEELAGIDRGLRAAAEGRFATPPQAEAAFTKFREKDGVGMTTEDIEKAIEQLPPRELARFRAWFEEFEASQFDAAIERDAEAGKLDRLAEQALAEHRTGLDRGLRDIAAIGERRYDAIKENLERDHFGAYVMINTDTSDYVVAPTISQVHAAFTERFGEDAPGWSTRIGISIFGLRKFAKLPFTNL
jgi:predicted transcriptional regulator